MNLLSFEMAEAKAKTARERLVDAVAAANIPEDDRRAIIAAVCDAICSAHTLGLAAAHMEWKLALHK